jgi:transposase
VVMTGVWSPEGTDIEVVLGVDTHLDFHVAVALDNLGRRLGELAVPTTTKGYNRVVSWAEAETAPELLALPAVGTGHAATLLVVAGDNPKRLSSEASFASLCGASPVEASSGKVVRHRLNLK